MFALLYLGPILGLIIILKRKLEVETKTVPDRLPDTNPIVRGTATTGKATPSIDEGGRATRCSSLGGGAQHFRVLNAVLAVPGATRGHPVKAGAKDMTQELATVAIHEL
jgi:hypothetical protein